MKEKLLKTPLSCRVNPQLKEELEQESKESEMTLSLYIEDILTNRYRDYSNERGDDQEDEVEQLSFLVEDLENENEALKSRIQSLEDSLQEEEEKEYEFDDDDDDKELELVDVDLNEVLKEDYPPNSPVGIIISSSKEEELTYYLIKLNEKYPDLDTEDFVLRSLQSAVKNEDSFLFTHTIKGYKPYPISSSKNTKQ